MGDMKATVPFQAELLDAVGEAVIATDPEGRIVYWNRSAEELFGWHGEEVLGRPVLEVTPGEPVGSEASEIMERLQRGESWSGEFRLSRKDGTTFPALGTGTPVHDESGELVGIIGVTRDLTEIKEAEEERERLIRALEFERTRLADLFEVSPAFICVLRGPEHVFELANPAYRRLVGDRKLVGRPVREALPEVAGQGYLELLDRVYRTGQPYVGEEAPVVIRGEPDGEPRERYVNFLYHPLRNEEDDVTGTFVHGVDVTDLVRARKEAESANQARAEFVATVSHELRTPLNAVLGYTELLQDGVPVEVPDEAQRTLERIDASARHLHRLIDEILSFSRLEAGQERIRTEPVSMDELLEEVEAIIEPMAGQKGLTFETVADEAPDGVETDPSKIRQILLNLLGNAVKFTEEGRVGLTVWREDQIVVFRVEDTGPGIPEDQQKRIFEEFTQVDQSSTRNKGGTGLGLAVSSRLVQLLGGELTVKSEVGKGSVFEVRLPMKSEDVG